jgi:hypothetical protein
VGETANGRGGDTALVQSDRLDAGNALNSSRLARGYAPRRCAHSPFRRFVPWSLLSEPAFWCLLPGVL